jgi:5-formyltetrahydrofolate cyclo-ligase
MIVPALSVDMQCFRLGYGKGYYDRLLQSVMNERVKTICPIPVELMLETLPRDKFDIPVDYVVCA